MRALLLAGQVLVAAGGGGPNSMTLKLTANYKDTWAANLDSYGAVTCLAYVPWGLADTEGSSSAGASVSTGSRALSSTTGSSSSPSSGSGAAAAVAPGGGVYVASGHASGRALVWRVEPEGSASLLLVVDGACPASAPR